MKCEKCNAETKSVTYGTAGRLCEGCSAEAYADRPIESHCNVLVVDGIPVEVLSTYGGTVAGLQEAVDDANADRRKVCTIPLYQV